MNISQEMGWIIRWLSFSLSMALGSTFMPLIMRGLASASYNRNPPANPSSYIEASRIASIWEGYMQTAGYSISALSLGVGLILLARIYKSRRNKRT